MKKGISVWAYEPKRPLPEVFQRAKEAGFDGVEVAVADDGPITPASTEADCRRIAAQAEDAGVALTSLASGLGWKYPILSDTASVRNEAMAKTRGSLDVARYLGLDTLLLVPGTVNAATPYNMAYRNAGSALTELASHAESAGVAIGVENVWNKFLLSPLEMARFLDEVGSPFVAAYFDVGNVLLTGFPEHWITILGQPDQAGPFQGFQAVGRNLSGLLSPDRGRHRLARRDVRPGEYRLQTRRWRRRLGDGGVFQLRERDRRDFAGNGSNYGA
jgi:hexulose-6-phosphate isomerase